MSPQISMIVRIHPSLFWFFLMSLSTILLVGVAEVEPERSALLRAGVGIHHAGLLPLHKSLVEDLFNAGLVKVRLVNLKQSIFVLMLLCFCIVILAIHFPLRAYFLFSIVHIVVSRFALRLKPSRPESTCRRALR